MYFASILACRRWRTGAATELTARVLLPLKPARDTPAASQGFAGIFACRLWGTGAAIELIAVVLLPLEPIRGRADGRSASATGASQRHTSSQPGAASLGDQGPAYFASILACRWWRTGAATELMVDVILPLEPARGIPAASQGQPAWRIRALCILRVFLPTDGGGQEPPPS